MLISLVCFSFSAKWNINWILFILHLPFRAILRPVIETDKYIHGDRMVITREAFAAKIYDILTDSGFRYCFVKHTQLLFGMFIHCFFYLNNSINICFCYSVTYSNIIYCSANSWSSCKFFLNMIFLIGLAYIRCTAFTKSMETQNCRPGIKAFLHFLYQICFQTLGNIVICQCDKYRMIICISDYVRCCYLREHCVSKIALGVMTTTTW